MTSRKNPPPLAISHVAARRQAEDEVREGRLPTVHELLTGFPWPKGLIHDITTWSRSLLAEPELTDPDLREILQLISAAHSPGLLASAISELTRVEVETSATDADLGRQLADGIVRCRVYLAAMGKGGRIELVRHLIQRGPNSYAEAEEFAFALGLLASRYTVGFEDPSHVLLVGQAALNRLASMVNQADAAGDLLDAPIETELPPADEDAIADALADVAEDRAEFRGSRFRHAPSVLVVPAAPANPAGARKDLWRSFEGIAGRQLPLAGRVDPIGQQIELAVRFPHAREAISTILRDLSSAETPWIRPTLLIGSPGCGKTSLARAIAEVIGLPSTIYACGGAADSSAMGTSAQWHSARPSVALDLIRSSGIANPLIVLDEVDKIDLDRRNGSLADALLGFLERGTAARYRDLALEIEVDLSHVSWIATANTLKDVPTPLRDRLRVITVPDPTWSHVGDLSRRILGDIAAERGLDERWIEDLAPDELDVLKSAWPGGSIRKLRRALEVLVDGRDALMGRA
ncbi:AAA family ATPase [Hansschlegelia sp. KR7-227]|uniref:AAA family ATPase n=1 Tax=Hansschlegelia sp. KR7-227 TaxID=3400914 RepID=UPI003C04F85B